MIWFSLGKDVILKQLQGESWSHLLSVVMEVCETARIGGNSGSNDRLWCDRSQDELILQEGNLLD